MDHEEEEPKHEAKADVHALVPKKKKDAKIISEDPDDYSLLMKARTPKEYKQMQLPDEERERIKKERKAEKKRFKKEEKLGIKTFGDIEPEHLKTATGFSQWAYMNPRVEQHFHSAVMQEEVQEIAQGYMHTATFQPAIPQTSF